MYDKKTWFVVTLCGLLLGYLFLDSQKKQRAYQQEMIAKQQQEEFIRKAAEAAKPKVDPTSTAEGTATAERTPAVSTEQIVTLETAEVSFSLTTQGGGVKFAALKHEFEIGDKKIPIHINNETKNAVGSLTTGANSADALTYVYMKEQSIPNKSVVFMAERADGMVVKKTYTVQQDQSAPGAPYLLDFDIVVENNNDTPLALNQYSLALGSAGPIHAKEWPDQTTFFYHDDGKYEYVGVTKFKGGWFSKEKSIDDRSLEKAGLAGVCDQFFTIAVKAKEPFSSRVIATPYDISFDDVAKPLHGISAYLQLPNATLAKGEQNKQSFQIFMGPKNNHTLRKMGGNWGDIMNYGLFSPISRFLNWVLHWVHAVISKVSHNWSWGISIIVLTLLVRTAIWPLYNKSNRSMKRMAKLKPEMDKIKERYPDDPTKVNQEVMKMYKKFGVNPVGGCLPMLLQIPIFFGFYKMLQYAVELRHEPFLWWVKDLSQPDTIGHFMGWPINLLPILMTFTSFAQMAMMPKTGDKMQQRMMMFMPFIFLTFCYSFASALALYWTTQNIFTIFQTWLSTKFPDPELKEKPIDDSKPAKKSFMERMIEKQEALQQAQAAKARGETAPLRDVTPTKKRPPKTGG